MFRCIPAYRLLLLVKVPLLRTDEGALRVAVKLQNAGRMLFARSMSLNQLFKQNCEYQCKQGPEALKSNTVKIILAN